MNRSNSFILCLAVCLLLLSIPTTGWSDWISGRMLTEEGTPMAGGKVIFFDSKAGPPPVPEKDFRPPDFIGFLDDEGGFRLKLPEGEYYIGAILWLQGEGLGPPGSGDIFFIKRDQPIKVLEIGEVSLGELSGGRPTERTSAEGRH